MFRVLFEIPDLIWKSTPVNIHRRSDLVIVQISAVCCGCHVRHVSTREGRYVGEILCGCSVQVIPLLECQAGTILSLFGVASGMCMLGTRVSSYGFAPSMNVHHFVLPRDLSNCEILALVEAHRTSSLQRTTRYGCILVVFVE